MQIDRETCNTQDQKQQENNIRKHVNFDLTNTYIQYNKEGTITQNNTGSLAENKLCYLFYS
ncbi:MAG: hypothetical protein QF535_10965, partial [Anaerolineales bacterium]|nr:hypothetical protein [Anaerolineales bacterium]